MTYWDVANSGILWSLVSVGLLYVFILSFVFYRKAKKRCIELGMAKTVIKKVITSSLTFSIVPSISIIIGLISLAAVIGTAWSWFRLSVVGAVSYELMAADMVGKGLGYQSLAELKNEPAMIMGAVMIVMSVGILSGNIVNLLFAKRISTSITSYNKKSGAWGALMTSCFMTTLLSIMGVVNLSAGLIHALTIFTSMGITIMINIIAKKLKLAWLGDFVLSISLILGMASGVMWHNLLL